jgi:hypothetical protein
VVVTSYENYGLNDAHVAYQFLPTIPVFSEDGVNHIIGTEPGHLPVSEALLARLTNQALAGVKLCNMARILRSQALKYIEKDHPDDPLTPVPENLRLAVCQKAMQIVADRVEEDTTDYEVERLIPQIAYNESVAAMEIWLMLCDLSFVWAWPCGLSS